MSKFSSKSWADLAYEQSESDSDLEENTLSILKSQSQKVVEELTQELPEILKSNSQINNLPRYFQRVLKAVQEENGPIVEVAVRDCPKGVTEQNLRDVLPIVSCTITEELVTLLIKKEDIIDHIQKKQLQQIILNQMCTLCIQKASEDLDRRVVQVKIAKFKPTPKYAYKEDRQPRKYQTLYQQKRQDD